MVHLIRLCIWLLYRLDFSKCGFELNFHDTYFVTGHFYYVLGIAAAIGFILFIIGAVSALLYIADFKIYIISKVNCLFFKQHLSALK